MNQIIVLSEGRIIETGGFDELARAGGSFAAMAARRGILPK
jgi:ABC-type multidrug transport system fused ATPase/permease subunit